MSYSSYRSETIGSTRMARRAGRYPAARATARRSTVNPATIVKSTLTTPKMRRAIAQLIAKEIGSAIASPIPVSFRAWPELHVKQRLVEVRDDVFDVLDADGEAHEAFGDADAILDLLGHGGMGHHGGKGN